MIIVTRPCPEGNELTQLFNEHNLPAQHFPLFSMESGRDLLRLQEELNQLNSGDYVIIVSPQVSHLLNAQSIKLRAPSDIHYFAVGQKSADLFNQLSRRSVNYPAQENSEGLLQLLDMKSLKNRTALILRGNSGRERLAKTLAHHHAKVKLIECYVRKPILYSRSDFLVNIHRQIIIITSIENLLQLEYYQLSENKKQATMMVTSTRIANKAMMLGWNNIQLSDSANNKILFKTIESLCHNKT